MEHYGKALAEEIMKTKKPKNYNYFDMFVVYHGHEYATEEELKNAYALSMAIF